MSIRGIWYFQLAMALGAVVLAVVVAILTFRHTINPVYGALATGMLGLSAVSIVFAGLRAPNVDYPVP